MKINQRSSSITILINAAIILFTVFTGCVITLHFLDPEVNPIHNFISEYVAGKYGFIMTGAFVCLGAAALLLSIAFWLLPLKPKNLLIPILLLTWSISIFLAAIYTTDIAGQAETSHGHIHNIASLVGFILLTFCTFLYDDFYNKQHPESNLWIIKWLPRLVLFLLFSMVITIRNGSPLTGLFQRFFIAGVVTWLIVCATTLKRMNTTK